MASTTLNPSTDLDAVQPPARLKMSYDKYLDWYDKEDGRRGEWVDGEVIVFMPTSFRHERLLHFLHILFGFVVDSRELGAVAGSGYELRTRETAAREPDLQIILNEHLDRATERRMIGAADVVVEIISPDSVTRDRRDKLAEYAAAGVPEYWIFDPREGMETVQLFLLGNDGAYVPSQPDSEGRCWSKIIPGVWFDPAWLTAERLPKASILAMQMAENPQLP